MDYVADTHALLWHLYLPERLGNTARQAFATVDSGAGRIFVPALVAAEVIMVAQKGRIAEVTVARVLRQLEIMQESDNYVLCPLTPETVLRSHRLAAIPDIFDRLIAAEAIERQTPLLTRDENIRDSGLVQTIWD